MYGDVQDRGAALPAGVTPFSQQYMDTAQKGYAADVAKPRRAAMQDLQQQYQSRGLQNSGLSAFAGMQQQQDFSDQDAKFRQNLGMKGADLGEENRQREQQHEWQVQDRDFRAQQLREQMAQQEQQSQNGLWGSILGGVGGLAGTALMKGLSGGKGLAAPEQSPYDPSQMDPYQYPPLFPD